MGKKPVIREKIDHYLRKKRKGLHRLKGPLLATPVLVNLATVRPIDLPALSKRILDIRSEHPKEWLDYVEDTIQYLAGMKRCNEESANILASSIRAIASFDVDEAINFGMRYIKTIRDERSMKTLTNLLLSRRRKDEAWDLLQSFQNSKWSMDKREELLRKEGLGDDLETNYLDFLGRNNLEMDFKPAVLLYGDIDMNIIDGSSVWLASLVETFCNNEVEVHLLLKTNIRRNTLLENLVIHPDIRIIEPKHFGLKEKNASPETAIQMIEILDGVQGGYRAILLRGLEVCAHATGAKSLWKRIYPYLTDYYVIDSSGSRKIKQDALEIIPDLLSIAGGFFIQTEYMKQNFQSTFKIKESQIIVLPPMIPDRDKELDTEERSNTEALKIGYSGKIAPLWGIRELIEVTEREVEQGRQIEVHIVGDKIHSDSAEYPRFKSQMKDLLENSPHVIWHGGVSRDKAIQIMEEMDVAWCYRSPLLELETLELSTKLVENMRLGLPMILTRNSLNEELLGKEFPLFVNEPSEIGPIISSIVNERILVEIDMNQQKTEAESFEITAIRKQIISPFVESLFKFSDDKIKRIVLNGHDLKFIGEFESHLKKQGHIVRRDKWNWGEPLDEERSTSLLKWAEIVFSEWGLANSAWYSNHIKSDQHHVVRIHLQEVSERARMFPSAIVPDGVNKFVFVADHVRDNAINMFEWNEEKTVTIPNYVDVERMEKSKSNDASMTLGIVGIVPQRKRIDRALNLLVELRKIDKRWKLIIKSKDPRRIDFMLAPNRANEMEYYHEQFARMEKNPHLRDAVTWEGHTLTIAPWYRKIEYILSPSDFESFHYSIADGVASGAMPIIWPWEGSEEIYQNAWTVVNTGEAVEKIIQFSQQDRSQQIADNREFIRDRYGMETVFPLLEKAMGLVE